MRYSEEAARLRRKGSSGAALTRAGFWRVDRVGPRRLEIVVGAGSAVNLVVKYALFQRAIMLGIMLLPFLVNFTKPERL